MTGCFLGVTVNFFPWVISLVLTYTVGLSLLRPGLKTGLHQNKLKPSPNDASLREHTLQTTRLIPQQRLGVHELPTHELVSADVVTTMLCGSE